MARNISLASGRHAASFSIRDAIGGERASTLSVGRPSFSLRDVLATVRETFAVIAAAGRVGSAVEARQTPSARDLKIAGLDKAEVLRAPYRV